VTLLVEETGFWLVEQRQAVAENAAVRAGQFAIRIYRFDSHMRLENMFFA